MSWSRRAAVAAALALAVAPAGTALSHPAAPVRTLQASEQISYSVSPEAGGPRTKFIATLQNEGPSYIEFGNPYWIARRTSEGWQRLRHGKRCAWTMEAYRLAPGASWSQRVGWLGSRCGYRTLEPGTYRVGKVVRVDPTAVAPGYETVVRARFTVTD